MTTPYQARRLLDAWIGVGPPLDERPTRPEVKDWVRVGLNDWCRLRAENEALTAQRDDALEEATVERANADRLLRLVGKHEDEAGRLRFEVEGLQQTVAHVCRARDEALEDLTAERAAHDADVVELGDHRDTLRGMLRQAQCERDRLRAELEAHVAWASAGHRAPHTPGTGAK